eukprot:scaffold279063_cov53-Prasinocladus_malaysianus.AAC.1
MSTQCLTAPCPCHCACSVATNSFCLKWSLVPSHEPCIWHGRAERGTPCQSKKSTLVNVRARIEAAAMDFRHALQMIRPLCKSTGDSLLDWCFPTHNAADTIY